jgi:hypothetical protein
MLPSIYAGKTANIPKLIGPDWFDTASSHDFFEIVNKTGVDLHAFTFHEYLGR